MFKMLMSIVIPIKNQFKIVKMCIDSIIRHYKDEDVVLVDDGSTEENLISYLKNLQLEFPNWTFITNKTSLGHSLACTFGINSSKTNNIFLLNSDTIVTKNSLNILTKVLEGNKEIAVVGPSTSSATGPQMLKELYEKRYVLSIDEIEKIAENLENNKEIIEIPLVNGFCFAIKKDVFEAVGKFDVNLNSYGNEKELLIRIRNAGYRTVFVKGCYVHHFGKVSYSHENINIGQACKDADKLIIKKHGRLT